MLVVHLPSYSVASLSDTEELVLSYITSTNFYITEMYA